MARVTPIRESGQTEYRLRSQCGADHTRQADAPVEYRLAPGDRPVERIGSGWRVLDRTPGAPLGADELDEARAIMSGADPRTGEQLIKRKTRVAKAAKLPALPLLKEIHRQGAKVGAESWAGRRLARAARAVARDIEHTAPVRDLEKVARAAGIDPAAVWPAPALTHAQDHAHQREEIGVRGWDLTLDAPKSVSVLYALGDADTARRIEAAYLTAARETVAQVEEWTARGQRGEHGNGKTARRIETAGLIGTLTLHTSARPVEGTADPHLHAHVMIANAAQGTDGKWGAVAAGGRELYDHVPAIGELMRARLRAHLTRELGVSWTEESPGRWEIAGIGPQVRDLYSRRRDQALTKAGKGASAPERRLAARRSAAPKSTGAADRAEWIQRARAADIDPAQIVAGALHRPAPHRHEEQPQARADRIAARVWTDHPTGTVSHPRLLAYAAQASTTATEAAQLAEMIAATGQARGSTRGAHLLHATRYSAPPLTEAAARTGQGPATRAAAHTIAALTARQALHEQRARSADAQTAALTEATRSHTTAWKQGTTRARAQTRQHEHAEAAHQARAEAARLRAEAAQVRRQAITADLHTAQAQAKAREALATARALALWRAAQPPPRTATRRRNRTLQGNRPWQFPKPHPRRKGPGPNL